MYLKFLLLACLLLFRTFSIAQQIETFKGKNFIKKQEKWYDSNGFEVNSKVITVRYKNNANPKNTKYGKLLRINKLGFIDIEVPSNMDILKFAEVIQKDSNVESIDINTIGEYSIVNPNDPRTNTQWYINKIQMPNAWDFSLGRNCVTIAIVDSGVDWLHQDLGIGNNNYQNIWLNPGEDAWADPNNPSTGNNIDNDGNGLIDDWKGWNYADNSNNSRTTSFHGTHVAGIASAKTNNSLGIAGIAGGNNSAGVQLMPVGVGVNAPDALWSMMGYFMRLTRVQELYN